MEQQRLIWIILETEIGKEKPVFGELLRQGIEAFLPLDIRQRKQGRTKVITRPCWLPGYVFAHVSSLPVVRDLRGIEGVSGTVLMDGTFTYVVRDEHMIQFMAAFQDYLDKLDRFYRSKTHRSGKKHRPWMKLGEGLEALRRFEHDPETGEIAA